MSELIGTFSYAKSTSFPTKLQHILNNDYNLVPDHALYHYVLKQVPLPQKLKSSYHVIHKSIQLNKQLKAVATIKFFWFLKQIKVNHFKSIDRKATITRESKIGTWKITWQIKPASKYFQFSIRRLISVVASEQILFHNFKHITKERENSL